MSRYYRMDGSPYPAGKEGLFEWARDLEDTRGRIVGQDELWNGMFVSTVWIGLNLSFIPGAMPLIFETMVFNMMSDHRDDLTQERYSTMEEAEFGHRYAVAKHRSLLWSLCWFMAGIQMEYYDAG